jgi:hypothetical protein
VQWRIEEPDSRRIAVERAEDAREVVALVWEQLRERRFPRLERLRENHLAHRVDAIAFEEHVLGTRQADASRAEGNRIARLLGRVGVGAYTHARRLVAPFHQLLKVLELLGLLRRLVLVDQSRNNLRGRRLDAAGEYLSRRTVD